MTIGPGKVQYFFLFFLTLLFYVEPRSIPFVAFLAYGAFVVLVEPDRLAVKVPEVIRHEQPEVGEIFSVQGQNTFLARLHPGTSRPALKLTDLLEFSYGMDEPRRIRRGAVLERFFLDQAQWIRILSHDEIDEQSSQLPPLERHRRDAVYRREGVDAGQFLGSLVGVVQDGTDVSNLRFLQAGQAAVAEGDLVQVDVGTGTILYQVVNASESFCCLPGIQLFRTTSATLISVRPRREGSGTR